MPTPHHIDPFADTVRLERPCLRARWATRAGLACLAAAAALSLGFAWGW